jgi:hypothetical protein
MQEKSLAPQQPDGADQDTDIEPTGAPEEFGFPEKPTVAQLRCWRNQERFLKEFAKCGIVGHAAKAAEISVSNVEYWQSTDTYGFKKRKGWAAQVALGDVEREIWRRAIEGVDRPLVYQGRITRDEQGNSVTVKEYSDNLLMFLTKKLDPSYKDNYQPQQADTHTAITQVVIEVHDYQRERNQGAVVDGQSRELPEEDMI